MRDLDLILELPKAGRYANPLDPEAIIPVPFGNMLDPNVVPDMDEDGNPTAGFTPAVCVNIETLSYAVSCTAMVATPPVIFVDEVRQTGSPAFWNPGTTFEGHLTAGLVFSLNSVLEHTISVRTAGMVDAGGFAINNVILAIYFMLTTFGGWTIDDFDRGTCEQTMHDINALGYGPFVFCFNEEKSIRDWLLEILPAYHTDFIETANGQLAMILDRSTTVLVPTVDYHVLHHELVDQGSPNRTVAFTAHAADVANRVLLHGQYNWVTGQTTASYTSNHLQSQSAYEDAFQVELTFRAMYTMAHATAWLQAFYQRHAFEPRTLRFTLRGLHGMTLITPRFITLEWPALGWQQHLLKIKKTTISFSRQQVLLECVDGHREVTTNLVPVTETPVRRQRRFPRRGFTPGKEGDGGQLFLAPTNTRNEAANGNFELGRTGQWDMKAGNAADQWVITRGAAQAHQGQWYALSVLGAGTGFSETLRTRCDPQEYVWVSAFYRRHTPAANGYAHAIISFYDVDDLHVGTVLGNYVPPTVTTYLESVAFAQAPAGTFYYRAGIGFLEVPTAGQWRVDTVRAKSGTLTEVFNARAGDLVTRNAIPNGDFELGVVMYHLGPQWIVSNHPDVPGHSGIWKAAHEEDPSPIGETRLTNFVHMAVTPGQAFRFQVWFLTVNNPNGTARLGVTWLDAQKQALVQENATVPQGGSFPGWTLGAGEMLVPNNAAYVQPWVGVTNHTGGAASPSYWVFDDWLIAMG